MEKSNRANRFSTEVRARAVRMIFEHEHEYANQSAAIMAIAPKIGCGRNTLRWWVKQSDIDRGRKEGQTSDERAQIKAMEREIRELRQANEILRNASAYFAAPSHGSQANDRRAAGRSSPAHSNDDRLHPLPGSRYAISMRGDILCACCDPQQPRLGGRSCQTGRRSESRDQTCLGREQ
jgi:transposase-like protein